MTHTHTHKLHTQKNVLQQTHHEKRITTHFLMFLETFFPLHLVCCGGTLFSPKVHTTRIFRWFKQCHGCPQNKGGPSNVTFPSAPPCVDHDPAGQDTCAQQVRNACAGSSKRRVHTIDQTCALVVPACPVSKPNLCSETHASPPRCLEAHPHVGPTLLAFACSPVTHASTTTCCGH